MDEADAWAKPKSNPLDWSFVLYPNKGNGAIYLHPGVHRHHRFVFYVVLPLTWNQQLLMFRELVFWENPFFGFHVIMQRSKLQHKMFTGKCPVAVPETTDFTRRCAPRSAFRQSEVLHAVCAWLLWFGLRCGGVRAPQSCVSLNPMVFLLISTNRTLQTQCILKNLDIYQFSVLKPSKRRKKQAPKSKCVCARAPSRRFTEKAI